MNNKGFTLIELLGVIVLLGVITTIAVPSISGISHLIQKNMLEKKIELMEEAAILFGEDIKGSIINSDKHYKEYACKSFLVSDLVPEYLSKDNENNCLSEENNEGGCIVNPTDKEKFLDLEEVIIYYKNKRIYAKIDTSNEITCE